MSDEFSRILDMLELGALEDSSEFNQGRLTLISHLRSQKRSTPESFCNHKSAVYKHAEDLLRAAEAVIKSRSPEFFAFYMQRLERVVSKARGNTHD